ncbi:alpha/beta hydrolase [Companilactobacillus halodurans]|uniref:Alpha/beta hydrolase n=1 Tax=Companilactobacillus halodurans TaxID=2584183 RepID=A0A5P0ZNM8_9LACO|nr:alpha/beta hydrolase [Companilactobacillus halodurans]MQS75785.1 alpha/beta hydrolase [Companilactobacillus halodurans]MQS96946.1 alpha/beta hydrolase [Companilactobacillus halodurans]
MTNQKITEAILAMRKEFQTNDDKRDAGLPTKVKGVKRIDNLSYGPDPKWNLLDIYLPENVDKPIPTVINIHGGGWCYGTKETYQFYGLNWAKNGFAFVNPNYQLAPDAVFPEELNQVDQYIHWVANHAKEYDLDTNNVFLVGDSAGGQMAEQYVTILTNNKYRKLFGYELPDLKFRAVALNSSANFMLDPGTISGAVGGYFTDEVVKSQREKLDTEKYINQDFLPTYISTANNDFVRNNSIKMDGFLTAKGITHICKMYGDQEHPRAHVFLINQKDDIAKQANDDEAEFFKKYLK